MAYCLQESVLIHHLNWITIFPMKVHLTSVILLSQNRSHFAIILNEKLEFPGKMMKLKVLNFIDFRRLKSSIFLRFINSHSL